MISTKLNWIHVDNSLHNWIIAFISVYCNLDWLKFINRKTSTVEKWTKKNMQQREEKSSWNQQNWLFFIMNKIKHDKLGMCCMPTHFTTNRIYIYQFHAQYYRMERGSMHSMVLYEYIHINRIQFGMVSLKSKNSDSDSVWDEEREGTKRRKNEWDERKLNRFNYFQYIIEYKSKIVSLCHWTSASIHF